MLALLAAGCRQPTIANIINSMASQDRILPQLVSASTSDMYTIHLSFSEHVFVEEARIDGLEALAKMDTENSVTVTSSRKLDASHPSTLFIRVRDSSHNSSAFMLTVYARNGRLPDLQINEFSSKGTKTQPDRIELEIRSDGNLEGLCVMDGTKGNENFSFTLPDIEVATGDYVVIYWTEEVENSIEETGSGNHVYSLAAGSTSSLAGNNGVFVVYPTGGPDEDVIDALVYTNGEATTYSGFGSARVEASYNDLVSSFDWMGPAFNSRYSTSTRTVSRRMGRNNDTNTASDFYITVTRGETFGRMNTSAEYEATE